MSGVFHIFTKEFVFVKVNKTCAMLTRIMLTAEKECVPKTTNTSMWSTNLEVATRAIRYWNMRVSQYKQQKGNSTTMLQELIAGKVTDDTKTVKEAQQERVEAWKYLRRILKEYKGERLKDLEQKVQVSLAEADTQKAKEYTQLIEKEKGKDKWREIKRALDRSIRDPLSTITIPGTTTITNTGAILTNPDITLTTKNEFQEAIINIKIQHFSAAEQPPIGLNTTLFDAIGPHCTSTFCDEVLQAKFTDKDKENIDFIEAYELLQITARPNLQKLQDAGPHHWLQSNIKDILNTTEEGEKTKDGLASVTSLEETEISTDITVE